MNNHLQKSLKFQLLRNRHCDFLMLYQLQHHQQMLMILRNLVHLMLQVSHLLQSDLLLYKELYHVMQLLLPRCLYSLSMLD